MTSQQQADLLLAHWQTRRDRPGAERLADFPQIHARDEASDFEALLADIDFIMRGEDACERRHG